MHLGRDPADDFGRVVGVERRVTGIDPLRRECDVKITANFKPGAFEFRHDQFIGGSWIGRALQDDQLILMQIFSDSLRSLKE